MVELLNQVYASQSCTPGFLKITFVYKVGACVCVCVCVHVRACVHTSSPRPLITNSVIYCILQSI